MNKLKMLVLTALAAATVAIAALAVAPSASAQGPTVTGKCIEIHTSSGGLIIICW